LTVNRGIDGLSRESHTMESESALIPRADVFAEATLRNLEPSEDRFDRFRAAGLITDLANIDGSNQRGFTPIQKQRFLDLLELCKALGSKRPRASALAFWLCWNGAADVPPELVCEHIERSVKTHLRFMARQYDRRRVPARLTNDPERWRKAGMPWARSFIKEFLAKYLGNGLVLDILSVLVGLLLRAVFSDSSFESVAGLLKRLAFLFGNKDVKLDSLRRVWNMLRDATQLVNTDERKNVLLMAVREVNAQDAAQIIDIVHDTQRTIAVMARVYPMYNVEGAPAVPDPSNDTAISMLRIFPGAITAVSVLTREEPHAIEMRENLRSGNVAPVLAELEQVRVARDSILARFSKEKT
jgi:hypothetical protein